MILIADSGSTKTDWVALQFNKIILKTQTIGLSPQVVDSNTVNKTLLESDLNPYLESIKSVYFYGTGCSSDLSKSIIFNGIKAAFNHLVDINIEHDLLGAVRSLYRGKAQLMGILGTGSNVCHYDGQQMTDHQIGLGYIWGDEGGGGDLGRGLLQAFFQHRMPLKLAQDLKSKGLCWEAMIENVYKKPMPNRYLASFVPWISEYRSHPFIQTILSESFNRYFNNQVGAYASMACKDISLVGSVAHVFSDEIRAVAQQHRMEVKEIIQSPIDGLVRIHQMGALYG